MIVCICNAVTERDIDEAIAAGATSVAALRDQLAVSSQCGSCHGCVEACLDRALSSQLPCCTSLAAGINLQAVPA